MIGTAAVEVRELRRLAVEELGVDLIVALDARDELEAQASVSPRKESEPADAL